MNKRRIGDTGLEVTELSFGSSALGNMPDTYGYEVETEHDLRAEAASAVITAGGKLRKLDVETQSLDDIYAQYFKELDHVSA